MKTRRIARLIGHTAAVAAALTLAVLLVPSSDPALGDGRHDAIAGEQAATSTAAPTAEEAVRIAVETAGARYAGPCDATRSPQDIGKVCSTFVAERGDLRAYLVGRTFSEYSRWLFVERRQAGWILLETAPLDFFASSLEVPWPR